MGVCCVKQHNQDQGEFAGNTGDTGALTLYKGDKDAIHKIILVQSLVRRHRAMRQLKELCENKGKPHTENLPNEPSKSTAQVAAGTANNDEVPPPAPVPEAAPEVAQNAQAGTTTENSKVRELESKLGAFKPEAKADDSVKREQRDTVLLDNGARYTGQWYVFMG